VLYKRGRVAHAFVCGLLFMVLDEKEVVMGPAQDVREVVEPLVAAAELELWDVELGPGLVRILVDRPEGVDLDALGQVTEAISKALDERDVAPRGRYLLEVSSPGVERTLRTPQQYRRYIGAELSVKTVAAIDGSRRFRGVLRHADDTGITFDTDDVEPRSLTLTYDQIQKAHTVLVWGPTPKDARRARRGAPVKDTAS
jgi:ribosome maturation factor RimP